MMAMEFGRFSLWIGIYLSVFNSRSGGSTHWVVTEDGRVQSQTDSVFNMRRPYDLVAFMKQEERSSMLQDLKQELLVRKDEIDSNEDRDTGLEQRLYKTDLDCIKAGKPLPEYDLYISTVLPLENKGIRPEEHIDLRAPLPSVLIPPDCTIFSDLDFSVHSFEHLEGLKDRHNLSGTPELGLKNAITHRDNVDDYGHLVFEALKKNKTSWVLYNMAAFYWRIKGDPYHVIECVRRALHFSPRNQKDVALISLANVLHRARYSNEAAVVVHSALDISKELNVNHFTLGNIYAVLGEFNNSIICFENTLKIQPDFEAAEKRKHAVLCHAKLEHALEAQHRNLQQTLDDLRDFQKKHDFWQQQNEKLQVEQVSGDVRLEQQSFYEDVKMKDAAAEGGEYCRMVEREGKQVLLCTWGKKSGSTLEMDFAFLEENEEPKDEGSRKYRRDVQSLTFDYSKPLRAARYSKYRKPAPKFLGTNDWPSKDECDTYVQKVPDPKNLSTVYLSPENKGFEVEALLTKAQHLAPGTEHPLPWYPPICTTLYELRDGFEYSYDHIDSVKADQRTKVPAIAEPSLRTTLLGHVKNGKITEEEVGQRILTAMQMAIRPSWVLYNLAGLYWRLVGNNYHGIECIRRALVLGPNEYKDVVLNNLANILYKWGQYDDAVKVMTDAIHFNDAEPLSHFLFGNILWATKNYTGAIWHYEKALEIEPDLNEALTNLRAIRCYQKYHQATQSSAANLEIQESQENCPPRPNGAGNGQQTESRLICKMEHGEEKCVIETRMRSKANECEQCTQTCTITPIKMDSCRDGKPMDPNQCQHRQMSEDEMMSPNRECESCLESETTHGHVVHKTFRNKQKQEQTKQDETPVGGELANKLNELNDFYQKKESCTGEECNQFKMQGNQKPHIKLDLVNGVLHQKLIFIQSPNELQVEPHECVIFNDGSKSSGCSKEEYLNYVEEVELARDDMEALETFLWEHLQKSQCTKCTKDSGGEREPEQEPESEPQPQQVPENEPEVEPEAETEIETELEEESEIPPHHQLKEIYSEDSEERPQGPPESSLSRLKRRIKITTNFDKKFPKELSDEELPDTLQHIDKRLPVLMPTLLHCKTIPEVNFRTFTSTWLSVTAKGINLRDHIDFDIPIKRGLDEPFCMTDFVSLSSLDHLPSVADRNNLDYHPESGLKEVLQRLGGEAEPTEVMGARIAMALQQNKTSWVLTNVAALYWRVEGDAKKAIDCLRLSLANAPREFKDSSLISLANILHRSDRLNDAIFVTNMALEISNKLPVSHFTMANLYASKGIWNMATMFYEATLGLQSVFEPAMKRLKAIQCMTVKYAAEH